MKFISVSYNKPVEKSANKLLIGIPIGFIIIILAIIGAIFYPSLLTPIYFVLGGLLIFVSYISSVIVGDLNMMNYSSDYKKVLKAESDEQNILRLEAIENAYGLNLTYKELHELHYPDAEPTEELKLFGSFERANISESDELLRREIILVWVEKELRLYGFKDEAIGAELPRIS